jgi:hypothetical protein
MNYPTYKICHEKRGRWWAYGFNFKFVSLSSIIPTLLPCDLLPWIQPQRHSELAEFLPNFYWLALESS